MKKHPSHQCIVHLLIRQIFTGKLAPGTKLPPLKQLSREMDIDPASLRIALKQLEAMHVLDIRRSDGAYVKDYTQHAGLDFLTTLFTESEACVCSVDEYLLDEAWEFWIAILPEIVRLAAFKYTPKDIRRLVDITDDELNHLDDPEKLIALEIQTQDIIAGIANNIFLTCLFNMTRSLREQTMRSFITHIDTEDLKTHVAFKKGMLKQLMSATQEDISAGIEAFRASMNAHRLLLRKKCFQP